MTEKREKIIVLVVIAVLSGSAIWGWIWFNSPKEWIVSKSSIREVTYFEKGINQDNTCVVVDGNINDYSITPEYICLKQSKIKVGGGEYGEATEIDYVKWVFYDLLTRKKMGEVNLTEIINQYLNEGFMWRRYSFLYTVSDKAYAVLGFNKMEGDTYTDRIEIYINLYTGEVEDSDEFYEELNLLQEQKNSSEKRREYDQSLEIIAIVDKIGLLKANGFTSKESYDFSVSSRDEESILIRLRRSMLPEENEQLYTEFPGLKKYQGKEDDMVYLYLNGYPTAEEILSMFLEEGQEISFEGCILPERYSIDGKEHEISSFEDYYQWSE